MTITKNKAVKLCSCRKYDKQKSFGTGYNLALLFGCFPEETVLLVGPQLSHWKDIFPNVLYWECVSGKKSGYLHFGLVLYHSDSATSRHRLVQDLKILKSFVRPGGTLLFFARNCYSFARLKQLKENNWKSFFSQPRFSLSGYKKVLQRSGFLGIQDYLVFPNLESLEEIVSVDSKLIEVPFNCHLLLRLARRYKFIKYIADGYIFINSSNAIEETPILKEIENNLCEAECSKNPRYRLERFDLRMRGAMVLFLSEQFTGNDFVVRVIRDFKTKVIVSRNEQFLQWLQSQQNLREELKHKLPCPITKFDFIGSTVFIETLMKGVLAWKVNSPTLREVIFEESWDFIYQLQQGTRWKTKIDEKIFQELFSFVIDRLASCDGVNKSFFHEVIMTIENIKQYMIGQDCVLSASHGDYGYGNILVDPHSGKLTGVIDWDTGRRRDFIGLDIFNLLVQRERIEKGHDVFQAFAKIVRNILSNNSLDSGGKYAREFGVFGDTLKVLMYIGLLRYASRSAQYPKVYNTEQDEYVETLQFLKTEVPL